MCDYHRWIGRRRWCKQVGTKGGNLPSATTAGPATTVGRRNVNANEKYGYRRRNRPVTHPHHHRQGGNGAEWQRTGSAAAATMRNEKYRY